MGAHKLDWSAALQRLLSEGLLAFAADTASFELSASGQALYAELQKEAPFYQYEYDAYFQRAEESAVHAEFCRRVYGADFSQHGLIDQAELAHLLDLLHTQRPRHILDAGCGSGRISAHIAQSTNTPTHGIDISPVGIAAAQHRYAHAPLLSFAVGNLNDLDSLSAQYDAILFLDTLYYADSLADTLAAASRRLAKGGKIYAYFSQWIMDTAYAQRLHADHCAFAQAAQSLALPYTYIDLSESGKKHWKLKYSTLVDMRPQFEQEGSSELWTYRIGEAQRYAHWGDDKYARYLFTVG